MRRFLIFLADCSCRAGSAWLDGLRIRFTLRIKIFRRPEFLWIFPRAHQSVRFHICWRNTGWCAANMAFDALCRYRSHRTLEAGEYYFDHPQTAFAVFDTLAEGRVFEISVTVPEGFNTFQIADLLESKGLTTRDAFMTAAADPAPYANLLPMRRVWRVFFFQLPINFRDHVTPEKSSVR